MKKEVDDTKDEVANLEPEVINYEPLDALTDYGDGLSFYRRLAVIIKKIKKPQGSLFLEFGTSDQIKPIRDLFSSYQFMGVMRDRNNKQRVIEFI